MEVSKHSIAVRDEAELHRAAVLTRAVWELNARPSVVSPDLKVALEKLKKDGQVLVTVPEEGTVAPASPTTCGETGAGAPVVGDAVSGGATGHGRMSPITLPGDAPASLSSPPYTRSMAQGNAAQANAE